MNLLPFEGATCESRSFRFDYLRKYLYFQNIQNLYIIGLKAN